MSIVYRTSDRLTVKVGGLVFKISPLSKYQKEKIQTLSIDNKLMQSAAEAIKSAVKGVSGLKDMHGDEYSLEMDNNKELTEECVDDLMNLEESPQLALICASLLNGIPKDFVDPFSGKKLKGVAWVKESESDGKKSQE